MKNSSYDFFFTVYNSVHAYAFFELDTPKKYMGIIVEYWQYAKEKVRQNFFFVFFYPYGMS